jgi:hypothetical protein
MNVEHSPYQNQHHTTMTTDSPSNPTLVPATGGALSAGSTWKKKLLIVLAVIVACCGLTAAATAWWVKRNVYASPLKPVSLTQAEQEVFDEKLGALTSAGEAPKDGKTAEQRAADEKRTLVLSAREINAYLNQQGIGQQVKVDLADGSLAATALIPVDKGVPFLGGKTLRLTLALSANMGGDHQPAFRVTDVSIGGVPLPNAWLGDLKGVNLLASNIESDPVVKRFFAGIREFEITSGSIRVLLNE